MKKIMWMLVTMSMVVTLLLASCSQQKTGTSNVNTSDEGSDTATITTTMTGTSGTSGTGSSQPATSSGSGDQVQVPAGPQYGGMLNMMQTTDIQGFDHATYPAGFLNNVYLVNDTLVQGDWARGAAGTGEIDWSLSSQKRIDYTVGQLAESFQIPEPGTLIFTIRKGVHYAMDPNSEASKLVNGREMTPEDVVFSLNRHIQSPMSYLRITQPTLADTTTVTLEGDRNVVIKTSLYNFDSLWLMIGEREIWPKELIDTYGSVKEWYEQVGTGGYMMTDYVQGSTATFNRNDNYWQKDPVGEGKGNQLPYLDGIKLLIIGDQSTQTAALRTGNIDQLGSLNHDNYVDLTRTTPRLQYHKYLTGPMAISMRQDNPDLPFHDIRVRQALMMAIDYDSIINEYYGGDAVKLAWPLADIKGYDKAYMPLDEMPQSVQDLFSYKPEEAKQLLSDAGYPEGFKSKIVVASAYTNWVEYLSIIKNYWSKIGVDVDLQLVEIGTYFNMTMSRMYDQMLYGFFVQPGPYAQLLPFTGYNTFNRSWVQDTTVDEAYKEILQYNLIDQSKVDEIHKNLMPYVLGKVWYIPDPGAYLYTFWQPWLKNYHGEGLIGYQPSWVKYVWIDQGEKKSSLN